MSPIPYSAFAFLIGMAILGCKEGESAPAPARLESPLSVIHRAPENEPLEDPPYPHMWYYRTELRNHSNRELRVIWFESYLEIEGVWFAGNALGKVLRSEEFSSWYADGDSVADGVILPGETAVCDVNWHGGFTESVPRAKWAYIAVDEFGFDYFVEGEVPSDVLKHLAQDPPAGREATESPAADPPACPEPPVPQAGGW